MAFCNKCGNAIPDGEQFCPNCKQAMVNEQTVQATAPQTAWYQCKKCGAMIPIQGTMPIQNCPMCGEPPKIKEKANSAWAIGRIVAIASILLTFVASFLPFFTFNVLGTRYSISLWSDKFIEDAIILAGLLAIGLVLVCAYKKTKGRLAAINAILILAGIYIEFTSNQESLAEHLDTSCESISGLLNPGIGLYLMALGCIGIIVASFIMHIEPKE